MVLVNLKASLKCAYAAARYEYEKRFGDRRFFAKMRIELKIPPINALNDGNSAGAAACRLPTSRGQLSFTSTSASIDWQPTVRSKECTMAPPTSTRRQSTRADYGINGRASHRINFLPKLPWGGDDLVDAREMAEELVTSSYAWLARPVSDRTVAQRTIEEDRVMDEALEDAGRLLRANLPLRKCQMCNCGHRAEQKPKAVAEPAVNGQATSGGDGASRGGG
uniref:DksA C4-type domain-containing protein n=1 Tax=Globodera pallida TaxID=36090 RepID=A0A183CG03_GLOPA